MNAFPVRLHDYSIPPRDVQFECVRVIDGIIGPDVNVQFIGYTIKEMGQLRRTFIIYYYLL